MHFNRSFSWTWSWSKTGDTHVSGFLSDFLLIMATVAPLYTTRRHANTTRKTEKLNASSPCLGQVKSHVQLGLALVQYTFLNSWMAGCFDGCERRVGTSRGMWAPGRDPCQYPPHCENFCP